MLSLLHPWLCLECVDAAPQAVVRGALWRGCACRLLRRLLVLAGTRQWDLEQVGRVTYRKFKPGRAQGRVVDGIGACTGLPAAGCSSCSPLLPGKVEEAAAASQ